MISTNDIRDLKGPVPVLSAWWWLAALLLVVIAAALVVWWWKRNQPVGAVNAQPPPSPFELALRALQRLREQSLPVEEYYLRLSDVVRRYLEGQFQLRAPERTTEEFLYELSRGQTLSAAHQELLAAFLQESDLVKFARHQPGAADRDRAFAAAERFVRDTGGPAAGDQPSVIADQTSPKAP